MMIEAILFSFALQMTGYEQQCKVQNCVVPTVVATNAMPVVPNARTNGFQSPNYPHIVFIRIDIERGSPKWEGVVIHEMVHDIQHQLGKYPNYGTNPCDKYMSEKQAYEVENEWLKRHNVYVIYEHLIEQSRLMCDDLRKRRVR